jgi:predicted O-methyltransferase YrrM
VGRPEARRLAISGSLTSSWEFSEHYLAEDDVVEQARRRALEVGCVPVQPGCGATIRFLASVLDAKAVVEVGTGTGVSGVWLLRGMHPDGVLTTVDVEAEHTRLARETFSQAGIPPQRTRLITGRALEVLPRLSDNAYDLVLADAAKEEYASYLEEAIRLLRPGGVVAFDNALWDNQVADPAQRDPVTVAIRELARTVREDERLVPVLLPVGDGLLCARLR